MLIKQGVQILKINQSISNLNKSSVRPFWHWLNHAWNQYDEKRVEEVGPNRACAEWLVKCGGSIKFKNWGTFTNDYNSLPPGGFESYRIEEIKAIDACIMATGFEYLKGLNDVKKISFVGCSLLGDDALGKLSYVRNSLEDVTIQYCELVTDKGLCYLYLLKNLKSLYLNYLPNVQQPDLALKLLKEQLPNCKVEFSQEPKVDPETEAKIKNKKKKFPFF